MGILTVIFLHGDSEVDKIIDKVSHGTVSHVAIKILGGVLEATGEKEPEDKYPGVWKHSPDKYDDAPDAYFIDVPIESTQAAEAEALRLIGRPYGYGDCIRGGVYDLTGIELPGNAITANCSETVTRILRAGGFNIIPGVPADDITPADLYKALKGGEQIDRPRAI